MYQSKAKVTYCVTVGLTDHHRFANRSRIHQQQTFVLPFCTFTLPIPSRRSRQWTARETAFMVAWMPMILPSELAAKKTAVASSGGDPWRGG